MTNGNESLTHKQGLRWIGFYVVAHLLVSLVYIVMLVVEFDFPREAVYLHLQLIVFAHIAFGLLLSLICKTGASVFIIRILGALLLALYWFGLLGLYGLNWISNSSWGGNISYGFLMVLPRHLNAAIEMENYSIPVVYLLIFAMLVCLIILAYFLLIPLIKLIHEKLLGFKVYLYCLLFFIYFIFLVGFSYSRSDPGRWKYDPVFSAVTLNEDQYNDPKRKDQNLNDINYRKSVLKKLSALKRTTHIVLIVVDALRADRMPHSGYGRALTPFIGKLYDQGRIQTIDKFHSTCSESACGIMAALTSRSYNYMGYGLYDVSDVLKDAGYKKYALLSGDHVWKDLNKLYGDNHDYYIDGSGFSEEFEINDDRGVLRELKALQHDSSEPMFLFIHLMSAHYLGKNETKYNRFLPEEELLKGKVTELNFELMKEKSTNAYDNGVIQVDDYLKDIFKTLEDKSLLDDAIVIITGDHGEALGERGNFYHTNFLYEEDISIPLLWYSKSQGCRFKNNRYGTLVDIAPTILDCLDLPIPNSWQGKSLLSNDGSEKISYHQTLREKAEVMVIKESGQHLYKLMATLLRKEFSNFRLYDVYSDPGELNNLIETADSYLIEEMKVLLFNEFL